MRLAKAPGTLARIEHMLEDRQAAAELSDAAPGGNTMQTYKAPLRDMRFVLHELHDSGDA